MPLSRARESGLHIPKAAPRQGVPFLLTLCARTGTSRETEKASSHGCQKLTQRTAPETAGKAALPAPLRRASSLPYSKYPKPEGGRTVLRLFCGRFAHCPHARRRNGNQCVYPPTLPPLPTRPAAQRCEAGPFAFLVPRAGPPSPGPFHRAPIEREKGVSL